MNERLQYLPALKIWIIVDENGRPTCTYDKKAITRDRTKQIKLDAAAAAKTTASVPVAAESIVYMMTESGEMVVKH